MDIKKYMSKDELNQMKSCGEMGAVLNDLIRDERRKIKTVFMSDRHVIKKNISEDGKKYLELIRRTAWFKVICEVKRN